MDEPLSALDSQTHDLLMDDLIDLWMREKFTSVYVTHNLSEAVHLGHKVVVMSRRPGMITEVVDIDLALDTRKDHPELLIEYQQHLWNIMREEVRAAELELIDG